MGNLFDLPLAGAVVCFFLASLLKRRSLLGAGVALSVFSALSHATSSVWLTVPPMLLCVATGLYMDYRAKMRESTTKANSGRQTLGVEQEAFDGRAPVSPQPIRLSGGFESADEPVDDGHPTTMMGRLRVKIDEVWWSFRSKIRRDRGSS